MHQTISSPTCISFPLALGASACLTQLSVIPRNRWRVMFVIRVINLKKQGFRLFLHIFWLYHLYIPHGKRIVTGKIVRSLDMSCHAF
jgi:hypothetical protein